MPRSMKQRHHRSHSVAKYSYQLSSYLGLNGTEELPHGTSWPEAKEIARKASTEGYGAFIVHKLPRGQGDDDYFAVDEAVYRDGARVRNPDPHSDEWDVKWQ